MTKVIQRSKSDETLIGFVTRITYYSLRLLVLLIAFGYLSLPMNSVIAVVGASVLAVYITLQDSVAKSASGVLIIGLRPYVAGDFIVRPYVHVQDEPAVSYAVTEQVKLRFDQEGITIPFPQRDVHLYQSNGNSF